jgi:hypothetical protein
MLTTQSLAERGVPEFTGCIFGKNADAREHKQQSSQRRRVGLRCLRQIVGALRRFVEKIGDSQFRSNVDRLGSTVPDHQLPYAGKDCRVE